MTVKWVDTLGAVVLNRKLENAYEEAMKVEAEK